MKHTNRRLTIVALVCATFLAAMEATAVATVMPSIVGDLGGIHLYAWVFTAYMMSATVMVPIFGKLADTFGRKHVLQSGILVFMIGSLGSALSGSMTSLIICRAIQGLGAGAIQPVGITIVGDIYQVQERAKITAVFSAVWAIAGISGPLLGGFIVEYLSWHWIFYINIPFGVAAALVLQMSLHEGVRREPLNLDFGGATLLVLAVVSLLLGVNQPEFSAWALPLSGLFFVLLCVVELSSRDPLFPPALFAKRTIASASAISALLGGTMLATITYLPLYVQGVLGQSGSRAAAAIIPMAFGWPLASSIMTRLMTRIGYRTSILFGITCVVVGVLLIAISVSQLLPLWITMTGMGILGFGLGSANTPMLIAVQSTVEWKQRGVATASTLFFRTIGGTISVGFLGGILASTLLSHPELPMAAANNLLGPQHGFDLSREVVAGLSRVLESSLARIFWVVFVISTLAFVAGFSFPKIAIKPRLT